MITPNHLEVTSGHGAEVLVVTAQTMLVSFA